MRLKRLKKVTVDSCAKELLMLVSHDHHELRVDRQRALSGLPKLTLYYSLTPVRASTLLIMVRVDALCLGGLCSGSRRLVDYLARDGIAISRDRGRNHRPASVYGRATSNHGPRFHKTQHSESTAWCISGMSGLCIRSGRLTSPTSRSRIASYTW